MESVKEFLIKYDLAMPDKKYVVGFSGGWDSMALLHYLNGLSKEYCFTLVAAHLNHNWREDAYSEQENCRKFCEDLGIEFYCEVLGEDCPKTETAARQKRYEFFQKTLNKYNADAIFTAHNSLDNAETLIYRIVKGTGLNGLKGILKHRDNIYRPLINTSRETIEKYCWKNNLSPNCDSSNQNVKYKRNLIRKEIFPLLKKINPKAEKSINSLSQVVENEMAILDDYLSEIRSEIVEDGNLKTDLYRKLSPSVKKHLLYKMFLELSLEYDFEKIQNVYNFIEKSINSKISLSTDLWLQVTPKYIFPFKKYKDYFELEIKGEGEYKIPNSDLIFELKKCEKTPKIFPKDSDCIAYVTLNQTKFTLRNRQNGDFIQPLGCSWHKKMKDYLTDKKVLQNEKAKLILLCDGSEVLWVASLGINDKIKVLQEASHVLLLKKG